MGFVKTVPAEIRRNVSRAAVRRKIRQASSVGGTIDGFTMQPGYLYTVVRAITARVNQNWDGWPSDELKTSYHTFVGKPVFVNHQNSDPSKARGRVVAARYFENGADKGVECVMEVDAQRFPKLAHEIRTGGLDSVSMGAEAGFTICSMCGNRATDTHDMCDHVRFHKGEYLLKRGKKDPQLVYETCHKLGFFELSYVFEPADETAVVSKVIQAATASWQPGDQQIRQGMQDAAPHCVCGDSAQDHQFDDEFKYEMHPPMWCLKCPCKKYKPATATQVAAKLRTAGTGAPGQIRPFQDRQIDPGKPVYVYRNLADKHNGLGKWSVMQGPHVMGHGDDFHMTGRDGGPVEVVVRPGGHDKAMETGQKNVHAFFKGFIDPGERPAEGWRPVQYDFKRGDRFFDPDSGQDVTSASRTWLGPEGAHYIPADSAAAVVHESRLARRIALHEVICGTEVEHDDKGYAIPNDERSWPTMADAVRDEWGSVDGWANWAKDRSNPRDPKHIPDAAIDSRAEHMRTNYERYLHGSVISMIRHAFDETEAPEEIDTLRPEEEGSEEDFHSYVETPAELRDPNLDRTQQLDREQEAEGLDQDRQVENVEQFEAPDHAMNDLQQQQQSQDPHFAMLLAAIAPVKHHTSQMNEGRAREEHAMARRSTLATRSKTAAKQGNRRRQADGGLQTDGGDQSVNAQSTREPDENEFISQTPSGEAVELGDAVNGISNTESNLVARMKNTQQQLLRDAARWQQLQAQKAGGNRQAARQAIFANKVNWLQQRLGRKLTQAELHKVAETVETGVPEKAETVNPPLSGTDDQSLKGQNFQPADPNSGVQTTQPKDASVKDPSQQIFAAFDGWLSQGTGQRVASLAARNPKYVLAQAQRFAQHHNFHPDAFMPTLGSVLRSASRRQAVDLDVAAPGGRTDVTAPVNNTTDAEAQASQFDVGDFGHNAGDGMADPDLSTDTTTWAPGEGQKEGFKRASAALAVQVADLLIEAGLRPPEDKYNLIAMHENMRAGQVADRISLLSAFSKVRQADARRFQAAQRRVASGVSRGTGLPALPPGFTSGGTRQAAMSRTATVLEDRSTDGLMFI